MSTALVARVQRNLERRVSPYVAAQRGRRRSRHDDIQAISGLLDTVDDLSREARGEPRHTALALMLLTMEVPVILALVGSGRIRSAARFVAQIWEASRGTAIHWEELTANLKDVSPLVARGTEDLSRVLTQIAMAQAELVNRLRELERTERPMYAIPLLMKTIGLSFNDVGRMFGVTGETTRRWATGSVRVPSEQLAKIDLAADALQRLLRMFKPERLAEVIRRPAEVFNGKRALDWILEGRIADVADIYERLLTYQ